MDDDDNTDRMNWALSAVGVIHELINITLSSVTVICVVGLAVAVLGR